jgi:hypothetical protein
MLASATIVNARDRLVVSTLNSLIQEYGYPSLDLTGLQQVLKALEHFDVQLAPSFVEEGDLDAERTLKKRQSADVLGNRIQDILNAGGENYGVELKSSIYIDTNRKLHQPDLELKEYESEKLKQKLAQEICAFLNRTGGIILLGVANNLTVVGCDDDFSVHPGDGTPEDKADLIINSIVFKYFVKPSVALSHLHIQCCEFQGRQVVMVEITNMQTLAFLKKEAASSSELYIRIGTSAQPIPFCEVEDHFSMKQVFDAS